MQPTILLIDDNHDTLDLLEVFLFKEFEIATALNGFEGMRMAEELLPDLIITDIMMPVMDGIRFFNQLRRQEKMNSIPVIAMTSFLKKMTRKSLLNMGFNDIIAKPIERQTVIDAVTNILGPQKKLHNSESTTA